jgi:methyl-accepting chemotaxis protein
MHDVASTSVEERLSRIGSESEQRFLSLASGFPQLMSELRKDLEVASGRIERFSGGTGGGDAGAEGTLAVGVAARELLERSSAYFRSLSERDADAFEALRLGISSLTELNEAIVGLRDDALDMEVLAINAIVTARKAGDDGRGFAYIAAELQQLAAGTVSDTDTLHELGGTALESLQRFRGVVAQIEEFQHDFFSRFSERLRGGIDELKETVNELAEGLAKTVEKARGVEAPLRRIMGEIQVQDIIIQSLAHVKVVFEKSVEDEVVVADDGRRLSINRLCTALLVDIRTKLAATVDVFETNVSALRELLSEVQADLRASGMSDGAAGGALDETFRAPLETLEDVTSGIERAIESRRQLRDEGVTITKQTESVLGQISNLNQYVERLYPLQVMSRIQIAKASSLLKHLTAIEGIGEFVEKIRSDVFGSERSVSEGLDRVRRVVTEYSQNTGETVERSRGFADGIRSISRDLMQAREDFAQGLGQFSVFSDRFLELLAKAEDDIEGLKDLEHRIDALLADLGADMSADGAAEISEEESASAREIVRSLLDQFTIAKHKTSAASMVGMDVDHGDEEGELTLF